VDGISATYNDGQTATTVHVTLHPKDDMLDIVGDDGATITSWPLQDVHSVAKGGDGQVKRLRRGFEGAERLTLETTKHLNVLASYCPRIHHTTPRSLGYWKPAITMSALAVVSVFVLIKVIIPALAQQIVNATPLSFDARMGQTSEKQLIKLFALTKKMKPEDIVCKDKFGVAYLDALARRLTGQLETPLETHITVINHSMVNAIALPGGRIIVFNGLIKDAKSGNDLAGVLAHEIGHQAKRHPLVLAFQVAGTSALAVLFFGDISGGVVLGGLSQTLLDSAYQRDMESQADDIAISLLNDAGIAGEGFADFFIRLQEKQGEDGELTSYFSSHPGSKERSRRIRSATTGDNPALSPQQWDSVRKICD